MLCQSQPFFASLARNSSVIAASSRAYSSADPDGPDPSNGTGFVEIRGELQPAEGAEGPGQAFRAMGRLTDENLQLLQQNPAMMGGMIVNRVRDLAIQIIGPEAENMSMEELAQFAPQVVPGMTPQQFMAQVGAGPAPSPEEPVPFIGAPAPIAPGNCATLSSERAFVADVTDSPNRRIQPV